jgi:uncharacterized protein (DUF1015 family)
MAKIYPFRAYRYTPRAGDPARLITQPYDKITPEMQQRYFSLSRYNLAHIIRGASRPDDGPGDNVYTRAARRLDDWIAQGVLTQEPAPAMFAYFQKFQAPDSRETHVRKGLIALGAVEEYSEGTVFRHELTHSGPKQDRLQLLRHTGAHFGQLFLLYDDPQMAVEALLDEASRGEPLTHLTDEYCAEHTLWRVDDPAAIAELQHLLAPHRLLIADGHHRYETALAFRRENPDRPGADKVMMTLVNLRSPGLVILPTHRVIFGLEGFSAERVLRQASAHFSVEALSSLEALQARMRSAVAGHVVIGGLLGGRSYAFDAETSELDVVVLHQVLLQQVVGLSPEAVRQERGIRYVRGFHEAAGAPDAQAVFFLNPVRIDQVAEMAFSGRTMPQKSTDFYPKLLSGITIYKLE